MRIHDLGPRADDDSPTAKKTAWSLDGAAPRETVRERPFIDDPPPLRRGWEPGSRWGARPARAFEDLLRSEWARLRTFALVRLLPRALLAGCGAMLLASCVDARAVAGTPPAASRRPGANATRIERVRLGFGLSTEGRVSPGCVATSFALRDPIHFSMEVTGAPEGSTIRVAIHDVLTHRLAWSEDRSVIAGHSYLTFEIGRGLPKGRYRADSLLGDLATPPQVFLVHEFGDGVR